MIGFPEPPEPTGTVAVTVPDIQGLTVALSGNSDKGTALSGEAYTKTTGAGGAATFTDVPVGQSYSYTISGIGKNAAGETYRVKGDKATGSVGAMSANATAQVTLAAGDIEQVTAQYPLALALQDMAGNPLSVKPEVTFGGSSVTDFTSFTTASTGTVTLNVGAKDGYQARSVDLILTPVTDSTDQIAALVPANSADSGFVSAAVDAGGKATITLKLKKTVTDVVLPIPVPEGEDAMTTDTVTDITANFRPTTDEAIAELGENGVTLTQGSGVVVSTADTTITGLKLTAPLPDGTYQVTISGNGMTTVKTTLTIGKTSDGKLVVNVGGEPQEDGTITGGVTGVVTNPTPDADGNHEVKLDGAGTNTTITEGGTTTPSTGGVAGGTPVDSLDQSVSANEALKPGVMSEPVYLVEMTYDESDKAKPFIAAKVSIKNVTSATSGTFGLQYDPVLFDEMKNKTAKDDVFLNVNSDISFVEGNDGQPEPQLVYPADVKDAAYITAHWRVNKGTDSSTPALSGTQELFTVRLSGGSRLATAVQGNQFTNTSISVMPYQETVNGQHLVVLSKGSNTLYNSYMTQVWRETALDGQDNSVHLDAGLASRGGFYQFTQTAEIPVAGGGKLLRDVSHDICTELRFPSSFQLLSSAEFLVQDTASAHNPVENAEIKLFDTVTYPNFEADVTDASKFPNKPYATLKTSAFGKASAGVAAGTYYYTITHRSFWDYPNGTVSTDTDGLLYDSFTVDEHGNLTMGKRNDAQGHAFQTPMTADGEFINPSMDAKSFHIVSAEAPEGAALADKAKLSSLNKAYTQQDYYFTISPPAGYEWNVAYDGATNMKTLADKLPIKLYGVSKTGTTEAGMFRPADPAPGTLKAVWDEGRSQFKLAGADVTGEAVGNLADCTVPGYDALRAGDLVVTLADGMFTPKDMTLSITVGTGGTADVALDDTQTGADSNMSEETGKTGAFSETLKNGRTVSSIYTFKPDSGKQIDQVILNGIAVPVTEPQRKNGFTYQFVNVTGDESMLVTFRDENGKPLAEPVVTVVLGANGKADAAYGDSLTKSLTGPATEVFTTGTEGKDFTVTPKVDTAAEGATQYEIDKVCIDGVEVTSEAKAAEIPAASMTKGKTHLITVTFKEKGGQSTQVIVTSGVGDGLGSISPMGAKIHAVNETPGFVLSPMNGEWSMLAEKNKGAIKVTSGETVADESHKLTKVESANQYTYTLDPLTADTEVRASFTEVGKEVHGIVQIACDGTQTVPATVSFVRAAGDVAGETKFAVSTDGTATQTADGKKQVAFTASVPKGEWRITVSKQGYLDYTITGFKVTEDMFGESAAPVVYFGKEDAVDAAEAQPIILTPGNAAGGLTIGAADVGMVTAGWVKNAYPLNCVMGDVDESTINATEDKRFSDVPDMALVSQNYLACITEITYTAFKALGAA